MVVSSWVSFCFIFSRLGSREARGLQALTGRDKIKIKQRYQEETAFSSQRTKKRQASKSEPFDNNCSSSVKCQEKKLHPRVKFRFPHSAGYNKVPPQPAERCHKKPSWEPWLISSPGSDTVALPWDGVRGCLTEHQGLSTPLKWKMW